MASLAIFSGQCHGGESCTADPCMAFFEDPDHPGQCWCGHNSTAHELSANPCPTDGNSHFQCVLAPFNPASVCIRCGRRWFSHHGSASQGLASPTTSRSVSLPSPSSSSTSFSSPAPSVVPLPPNPPGAVFHASVPMPSAQAQAWYAPANAAPGPSQPPLGVSPSPLGAIVPTTGLYIPRAPAPQGNPFTSRQSSSSNSRPPRRSSAPVSQLQQFVFEVVFRTEGMPGTCGYSESEAYGFSPTKLRVPPENYHHAYVLRAKELGVGFTWSVSAHNNDLILPSFKPAVERHMSENGFTVLLDSNSPPQPDHASDFDFLECNQRARVGSTAPALFHPVDVNRVTFQKLKSSSSKYSRLAGVLGGTTPYLVVFKLRMGVLQGKLRGHGFHACHEPRLQHGFRRLDIEFAQEQPASEGVDTADSPDSPRCWAICVENDVSSSSMPPPASASSSLSLPRAPAPLLPLAGPSIQPATEAVDAEMADTTFLTISSPTVLSPAIPSPPTPIPAIWQDRQELSTAKVPPVLKAWLQRQTAAHETVSRRIYIQGPDEESIAKGLLQYIRARVQSLEEDPPLPEGVEIDGWSVEAMQIIPQFSVGLPGNTSLGEGVARIVWGHVWQLLLDEGNTLGFWTQVVEHNNFVTPVLLPPNLPLARPAQIFWETVGVFTRLSLEWLLECQGISPFIVSLAVLESPARALTRDFISEVTPNLSARLATWPPTPTTPLQIGITDPWSLIMACPGDVSQYPISSLREMDDDTSRSFGEKLAASAIFGAFYQDVEHQLPIKHIQRGIDLQMFAGAERLVSIIYDARQYLSASDRILYGVRTNTTQALLSDHLIRGLWLCRPVACADEVISQLEFHRIAHNLEDDVNVSQISDLDYTALQDRYTAAIIRWLHGGNGVERAERFLETTTGSKLLPLPMHIIKVNFDVYVGENVGVSAHTCFRTLDVLINGETAAYINAEIPESPYPVTPFDSFWDSCMVPTGLNAL